MTARQEAFVALKELFTALIMTMPERHLTEQEVQLAAQVLEEQFTKIMDQYDERVRHGSHRLKKAAE